MNSRARWVGAPIRASEGTEEIARAASAEKAREWNRSRVLESAAVIGTLPRDEEAATGCARARRAQGEKAETREAAVPKNVKSAAESRDKAQPPCARFQAPPERTTRASRGSHRDSRERLGGRCLNELRDGSLSRTGQAAVMREAARRMFLSSSRRRREGRRCAHLLMAEFDKPAIAVTAERWRAPSSTSSDPRHKPGE